MAKKYTRVNTTIDTNHTFTSEEIDRIVKNNLNRSLKRAANKEPKMPKGWI